MNRSVRGALCGASAAVRGKQSLRQRLRGTFPIRRVLLLGLLAPLLTLAVLVIPVDAERNASGSLTVFLKGGISPRTLPRTHKAPVAVRLHGGIRTAQGVPLPRVKRSSSRTRLQGRARHSRLASLPQSPFGCSEPPRSDVDLRPCSGGPGPPLCPRLPSRPAALRPSRSASRLQWQDLTGPHLGLGSGLLPASAGLLCPALPRSPGAGAVPHGAGKRHSPQRRALASLRPVQHCHLAPLSPPGSRP